MTEYKTGDEVTVRGWVIKDSIDDPKCVDVGFNSLVAGLRIHYSEIATHTPKPRELKVGDIVDIAWSAEGGRWTILAIHKDRAWLLSDFAGAHCTAILADLKLAYKENARPRAGRASS